MLFNSLKRRNFLSLSTFGLAYLAFPPNTMADQGFLNFISDFKIVARKAGISSAIYDKAFANIRSIDPEVLDKARFQPEFEAPIWDYFDNRVHERSVENGKEMARKYKNVLNKIEKRFGVNPHILLAIWSMETNYGEILKRPEVIRSTIRSLVTLAYADKKRAKFGSKQLIAALKILERGDVTIDNLTGSWAGAMGHTQFIPSSYLLYGVDFDGDGTANIWTSVPDALASSANLLMKNGWQTGRTWGYEVNVPANKRVPKDAHSLDEWHEMGVTRTVNKPFRHGQDKATLRFFDGQTGPGFLIMKNFKVIKAYNNADKYALAVGILADQIANTHQLVNDWDRPFTPLSIKEKEEMQRLLSATGHYNGKADGNIGNATKNAILSYQQAAGLDTNGYASKELLTILRQR
jgi:membrane-bound lytic murein transglycosylase B